MKLAEHKRLPSNVTQYHVTMSYEKIRVRRYVGQKRPKEMLRPFIGSKTALHETGSLLKSEELLRESAQLRGRSLSERQARVQANGSCGARGFRSSYLRPGENFANTTAPSRTLQIPEIRI